MPQMTNVWVNKLVISQQITAGRSRSRRADQPWLWVHRRTSVCRCNYLCGRAGSRQRGGGMFIYVFLHVHLLEEHCSTAQCRPLTFQLHLSLCTKAFLPAEIAAGDRTGCVGGKAAKHSLTSCMVFILWLRDLN